jgi:predicted Rossmann-fold nucleotide-binding protein
MSTPTPTPTPTPAPAPAPTPTPTPVDVPIDIPIDQAVLESPFIQEKAAKPLRVCCYGSSSSLTPVKYLSPAKSVGYILARRGHTCVNGAGSFGCMAAMNDGAGQGDGHIVGVIHEMWLVDSSDWAVRDEERRTLRDGGAHAVFDGAIGNSNGNSNGDSNSNSSESKRDGPKREMLVAGGKDLQERKRLLVDKADALIVLPGGPGTWDEVRVACSVLCVAYI